MEILICVRCVPTYVHVSSTSKRVCGDFVEYNQLELRESTLGGRGGLHTSVTSRHSHTPPCWFYSGSREKPAEARFLLHLHSG